MLDIRTVFVSGLLISLTIVIVLALVWRSLRHKPPTEERRHCSKLVQANSGTIEVQSEPGKGSIFTMNIPIHKGEI